MHAAQDSVTRWNDTAEGWAHWAVGRAALLPPTERMLDLALVKQGSRLLDVGCGSGEQTIIAARRVGTTGHVLATDVARRMIEATQKSVAAAGLHNVSTLICAAEALSDGGEPFDAAIGRLVLMLIPDPGAAARAVFAALRPGGAFAAMVHGDPANNPLNAITTEILTRHGGKAATKDGPGFFALADLGRLKAVLQSAGFANVAVSCMPIIRRMESAGAAVAMMRDSFCPCQGLIADLPPAAQDAAWAEVAQALARFESVDGFVIPGEVNLVVGYKSPARSLTPC